jgi:RNA polymerase-binding transcription factor DksA
VLARGLLQFHCPLENAMTEAPASQLQAKKAELLARRERLASHFQPPTDSVAGVADEQHLHRQNDEVVHALSRQIEMELVDVEAALVRLELGTYGKCLQCGIAIAPPRLTAMPSAVCCIHCAGER